jgi:hypothetical protein
VDAEDSAMKKYASFVCAFLLFCVRVAHAHVGNPDVYAEGQAGAYKLFVVVRPPLVIPGIADVEVRAETAGIDGIQITPIPLTGEAAAHPPVAEAMTQPSSDKKFFTGHLWLMTTGSWQIRFAVSGGQGNGVLSIPVSATAIATRKMTTGLGGLLAGLGVLLVVGMIGIVGAAAREAKLPPGSPVPQANRRSAFVAMTVAFAVLATGLVLGNAWWRSEAADYSGHIYKPLQMNAALENGGLLDLKLHDPGWLLQRKLDDLIPDHDHLMHLYMIRWPQMDVVFHLHPVPATTGEFQLPLPTVPAGTYRLYADVVHANGFPETIVGAITVPAIAGRPLTGDDAEGTAAAVSESVVDSAPAGPARNDGATANYPPSQRYNFADGYSMIWKKPDEMIAKSPVNFQFELLDPQGNPPQDMALYMGMLGHAAFVKTDGTTFAHIHPTGTVSMAAFMMANPKSQAMGGRQSGGMEMPNMPGLDQGHAALPNVVGFPYGFPSWGTYRIFVQMKHGEIVETGIFDATVRNPAT